LDVASSSHFASSYISFLDGGLAPSGGRRRERRRDARGQHACSLDSTAPAPTNNARLPRTAMHHLHRTQHYARLHVPLATPATPLAGLWRGVHPGHGLEVVVLDYSADGGVLRATKVTGDTHVPAGEVSWMAELRSRQGHLTPDEEDTFDVLEAEAWEQAKEHEKFRASRKEDEVGNVEETGGIEDVSSVRAFTFKCRMAYELDDDSPGWLEAIREKHYGGQKTDKHKKFTEVDTSAGAIEDGAAVLGKEEAHRKEEQERLMPLPVKGLPTIEPLD